MTDKINFGISPVTPLMYMIIEMKPDDTNFIISQIKPRQIKPWA